MSDRSIIEPGVSVKTELLAGLTTFLSMAYILALYPSVMSKIGLPAGGAMIAAALSAAVGTFLMGLLAKYPFALAPGVGIVPFFAYSVVIAMKISWQFAMMAVFVEGALFILLSLTRVREFLFDIIPQPLKIAIGVGIGLFIIFIALQGAKVVTAGPCLTTLVQFRKDFGTSGLCAALAIVGTVITAKLFHRRITGALLWGILITWGLGILCQAVGIYRVNPEAGLFSLYPSLTFTSSGEAFREFGSLFGQCLHVDRWASQESSLSGLKLLFSINFLVVIFTLLFDDLFNTIGTLAGIASASGMLDKNGRLPRAKKALLADAIATSAGALMGATTTTTYVESATGILAGGRTKLTAYATAGLFLIATVFAPLFTAIPAFAISPALIVVGYCMIAQIKNQLRRPLRSPALPHGDRHHALLLQHRRRHLLRLHLLDGRQSALRAPGTRQRLPHRALGAFRTQIHFSVSDRPPPCGAHRRMICYGIRTMKAYGAFRPKGVS